MDDKLLFIISELNLGFYEIKNILNKYKKDYIALYFDDDKNNADILKTIIDKNKQGFQIISVDRAIEELDIYNTEFEYDEISSFYDIEQGISNSSLFMIKDILSDDEITVHEAILHEMMCETLENVLERRDEIATEFRIAEDEVIEEYYEIVKQYHISQRIYDENEYKTIQKECFDKRNKLRIQLDISDMALETVIDNLLLEVLGKEEERKDCYIISGNKIYVFFKKREDTHYYAKLFDIRYPDMCNEFFISDDVYLNREVSGLYMEISEEAESGVKQGVIQELKEIVENEN